MGCLNPAPGWEEWSQFVLFEPLLRGIGIFRAIQVTAVPFVTHVYSYATILGTFCLASNTCLTPMRELGVSRFERKDITGLLMLGDFYEEYIPS